MKLINADALKICLQDHYGVIEQDCSISEEFADGAISGIGAAMFEVNAAPSVDAIPVEWLLSHIGEFDWREEAVIHDFIWKWEKEQEENNG